MQEPALPLDAVEGLEPINIQFPDQFSVSNQSSGPELFSIGNSNQDPNKLNIDFDDLIIKGLQLEESRKVKKQEKMERRRRNKRRAGASEEHTF